MCFPAVAQHVYSTLTFVAMDSAAYQHRSSVVPTVQLKFGWQYTCRIESLDALYYGLRLTSK
jgi:hypothetical protein